MGDGRPCRSRHASKIGRITASPNQIDYLAAELRGTRAMGFQPWDIFRSSVWGVHEIGTASLRLYLMGLNLSNRQNGLAAQTPEAMLQGEGEADKAHVVAGHEGRLDRDGRTGAAGSLPQ